MSIKEAEILKQAVTAGGTKLNSYDGNHGFYVSHGFEPVSWCKWDDNGADEGCISQSWLQANGLKSNITTAELNKIPNSDLKVSTDAIRAHIYIWRRLMEGRKAYTFEGISERVKVQAAIIKQYYDEQAPVDDAAVDVDYCCG